MEIFKLLLPVLTTVLGAGFSLLAIEYKSTRDQVRLLARENEGKRSEAISATVETLLLCVSGQISGKIAKKKVIEIYASSFMILEDGYYKQMIECFDENDQIAPMKVEKWIKGNK